MTTATLTLAETELEMDRPYTFHEYYDAEVMDQILAHPDGYSKRDIQCLGRYKRARADRNHVLVNYERGGKSAQAKNIGRLYPRDGLGLQSFPFDMRNPLLAKYYHDCDMVNSHYVLLNALADRWGLKHDAITAYIQNRDVELSKVSSNRGVAKVAFLKVAYGGNIKLAYDFYNEDGISPEGDTTLLKAIEAEMKPIVETCWREHKDLHKMCSSKDHPKFSCFSYVLQTEETKCLLEIVAYLKTRDRQVGVLIHDGCCIKKTEGEQVFPAEILRGAEAHVRATLGYPIQLLIKPWVHNFQLEDGAHPLLPADVLIDDRYAAQAFCEAMGDSLIQDEGQLWVFNEETGMWSSEKTALERVITSLNGTLVFKQMGPMGVKTYDYSGSVEKRSALVRMLPSVAPLRDGYMRERRHSDIGKLLFKDGIYDFKTDTFTKGFDSTIVFTAAMPRAYPTTRDETIIQSIRLNTFHEPFSMAGRGGATTGDETTLLHELMRASYGDFTRKKAVIGLGPQNCSKGMTARLLTTAFGSYAQAFNGNSLLYRGGNTESEREMTFVLKFCNARFALSSEIKIPADARTSVAVDGTILKTLASGGDEIQARRLHENSREVVNKAVLFIFANDMPKITPATTDVQAKIVPVNWSVCFVENPSLPNEKKMDAQMAKLYQTPEYGDAFIHILLDEYRAWKATGFKECVLPDTARAGLDDLIPSKRLGHVLLEKYALTNSVFDAVPFNEIRDFVLGEGWEGTDNKLGRELTSLGIGVGRRKEGRRVMVVRTGLKEVVTE